MPANATGDFVYSSFVSGLMTGGFNLASNNINMILVTSSYAPTSNPNDGYKTLANVLSVEATGTGYSSSGQALTSKNVWQDDYADLARFDADDVTWSSSTITASGAILLKLGTLANGSDSPLIAFYSFGANKSSSAGAFTVAAHASGYYEIASTC